ncbi:hypothetical protein EC912_105125 [Luteibacter rhizovicinus]|uniref:Uncharacterized protein n=1 Tax=Luteibacter rhizovicinus TaxID=242606 RepID=A0A4R3YKK3_9GAMM|nr:hypothetical protein [Luteibacter rhizovicinus]TCV93265.1 hypothetical protein EC912_105125 [Luteibacter rhizovicinus]
MRILSGSLARAIALICFVSPVCAQDCVLPTASTVSLPPLPEPVELVPVERDRADCTAHWCHLTHAELIAITHAISLYKKDMPKVKVFESDVTIEHRKVKVRLSAPRDAMYYLCHFGDPTLTIYIFDESGTRFEGRAYER